MSPFNDSDHSRAHALGVALDPELADQSTVDRLISEFNSALRQHEEQCDKFAGVEGAGNAALDGACPSGFITPPRQQSDVVGLTWEQYARTTERCAEYSRLRAERLRKALIASVVVNAVLGFAVAVWWGMR